jgi:hypothetical protein
MVERFLLPARCIQMIISISSASSYMFLPVGSIFRMHMCNACSHFHSHSPNRDPEGAALHCIANVPRLGSFACSAPTP